MSRAIKAPFHNYTFTSNTVPCKYGNSFVEALKNRACHLFGIYNTQKLTKIFERQSQAWNKNNSRSLIRKDQSQVVINLPFQRLILKPATEKKYVLIKNNGITLPSIFQKINLASLSNDLTKEILLISSIILSKTIFDLMYVNNGSIEVLLNLAFLAGIVKGLFKTIPDIIANKGNYLNTLQWKCSVEIFSEVATEITFYIAKIPPSNTTIYSALQSILKAVWKYLFEQIVGGTYFLLSLTELFLEIAKSGFKPIFREYFAFLVFDKVIHGISLGIICGSLLGVGLMNIFIEQCMF